MLPFFFPPIRRSFSVSASRLSGHSKWSKIKTKKGIEDAKRSQLYAKHSRDILVAARNGGSADPTKNTSLAAVLRIAKSSGVPKDNIERTLVKASGAKGQGTQLQIYEALAHGTVPVIIEALTDNNVRTLHSMRDILKDHDQLASVAFQFQRKGFVKVVLDKGEDFDDRLEHLAEAAFEAGAEDFVVGQDEASSDPVEIEFKCPPATLAALTASVTSPGMSRELLSSELIYTPLEAVQVKDEELKEKIKDLVEAIEEDEDTLRVWTTMDH